MSRIMPYTSQIDICGWIRTNQEQIQGHPAWKVSVHAEQAEALLQGSESFTYLLRKGEEEKAYCISFVKEDGGVKHQRFTLEYDRKGWYYKNGTLQGPEELVTETLEALIPQMMHCDAKACKILAF